VLNYQKPVVKEEARAGGIGVDGVAGEQQEGGRGAREHGGEERLVGLHQVRKD
jgi:hypothetical protein